MACQHKRPGRTARQERIQKVRERQLVKLYRKKTVVQFPSKHKQRDGFPGRIVAVAVPPGMSA